MNPDAETNYTKDVRIYGGNTDGLVIRVYG